MGFPQPLPDIPFLRATSFEFLHQSSQTPQHEDSRHTLQEKPDPVSEVTTVQERQLGIYQHSEHLIFAEIQESSPNSDYPGSLLATISSANGLIEIGTIDTDDEGDSSYVNAHDNTADDTNNNGLNGFWKTGRAPSWASDWGTDQYGHWVTFTVEGNDQVIIQRMRWIPPGRFLMGSPGREPKRYDDEGPQYPATLRTGFWLFDTTCTQGLWQMVMGNNPSRFKGMDRPIEHVSWNDVQEFLERINSQIPDLNLVLPSEMEWEYSCRAGSTTPFSSSQDITPDQANYNGEYPYEGGEIGLYRKCTIPVASLPPNSWGLYEMHGNVWEWTRDYWHENHQQASSDNFPEVQSDVGLDIGRVVRGGSWRNVARVVRSAVRDRNKPEDHSSNLGFRCALIQFDNEPMRMDSIVVKEEQTHIVEQQPSLIGTMISGSRISIKDAISKEHCPIPSGEGFSICTVQENFTFRYEIKPEWASAIGRDRLGLWAEISLEAGPDNRNASINESITQRLRWIPPGRFTMGSSESEWVAFPKYDQEKWCHQESPRHQVILTQGYWLFDTPCTQALWETVMGDNPSRFQSPTRPVDSVSWDQVSEFIEKLNGRIPNLNFGLPTEAQWEYACRAGSDTATYGGPIEVLGSNNTPVLDAIAWYGGNSGVEFELDNGYDSSDWREKQHHHVRAGTHPVGKKQANPWGLYDMLGNVWEWCRDGRREYGKGTIVDPIGPMEAGEGRMVRGGSWYYFARYVRAASRLWYLPGVRLDRLGFRCVGIQS
uniref:Formylglycine-generating enzyme, required for sulfatase activity, contains SUMF1/FGE domain n=1 Tax=Candidatus Kentrum sp. TUN TaxID=2126343 RepID=A0A450ZVA3_9GAMM|nr:MAG: Formylglycine-generating enzyme, required for sulfatase activity, contains SUMF1/FGE domain [Candidatus Kentron sp. TUN]